MSNETKYAQEILIENKYKKKIEPPSLCFNMYIVHDLSLTEISIAVSFLFFFFLSKKKLFVLLLKRLN